MSWRGKGGRDGARELELRRWEWPPPPPRRAGLGARELAAARTGRLLLRGIELLHHLPPLRKDRPREEGRRGEESSATGERIVAGKRPAAEEDKGRREQRRSHET
ncbi:unnamed protein product [Urochloa humidicola]